MNRKRIIKKKRTNILELLAERNDKAAIMKGINAGLEDIRAGRIHSHAEVMTHINEKLNRINRISIIKLVEELSPVNIDPKADLIALYYENPKYSG